MSDKPKNISTDVQQGHFREPYTNIFQDRSGGPGYRAEVHRDDGTWSYGLGSTQARAIADANRRLDNGDFLREVIEF